MPCLFFNNLPLAVFDHTWFGFKPEDVIKLRHDIASLARCPAKKVEFHFTNIRYQMLTDEARLEPAPIHIEVEWHAGRSENTKLLISKALYDFLKIYGMEEKLDIVFNDSPKESFFVEQDGQMISVSNPNPPIRYTHTRLHVV